jgi:hypothetical protein
MLCPPRKRVNSIRQLGDTRKIPYIMASFQPEIVGVNKPAIHHESTVKTIKTSRKLPVSKFQGRSDYNPLTPMGH